MFSGEFKQEASASDRRWSFFICTAFLWGMGAVLMAARISASGWSLITIGLYGLFLVLLAQLAFGCMLAVTGWWVLRRGGDPRRISRTLPAGTAVDQIPQTAIVMPIFNEDVNRVFAGLRVMYESLQATGRGAAFDWFILSDSSDVNVWIAEEKAWFELCRQVHGFGRVFYRKRRLALHHKSGNVADFCRRWGAKYQYLVVLDADSVMTGATFVRLASLMEANPQAGIIQTSSRIVLGRTLFQRINQFASRAYGPLFIAGANFWQLDNANFYGHNAILRIKPFMQFCAMPEIPPSGRLGTRILSHDTVEAALIRRAGYAVWADTELEGSYEESPPHLLASLQRDRRWCHGNLQHTWVLFSRGLTWSSRINLLAGIMAYVSSPLWLLFLLSSPLLFFKGSNYANNTLLFAFTMILLLLPKLLGALQLVFAGEPTQTAGGRLKILGSVLAETIYSMITAPILMLFYTRFIWSSFFGSTVGWGRQKRSDGAGPSWRECTAAHLGNTLFALAGGVLAAGLLPAMLPWLLLVLIGPLAAIPLSRLAASPALGWLSLRHGWFTIPEEARPPWELQSLQALEDSAASPDPEDFGLQQVVLDPRLNAIHVSLLRERQQVPLHTREHLAALCAQLLRDGPLTLSPRDKSILLWDVESVLWLHQTLWDNPASRWHAWWQDAFWKYLELLPQEQGEIQVA